MNNYPLHHYTLFPISHIMLNDVLIEVHQKQVSSDQPFDIWQDLKMYNRKLLLDYYRDKIYSNLVDGQ